MPPQSCPIPCVVLGYYDQEIVRRTLQSLNLLRDRISVIFIENPSENSERVAASVVPYMETGLVQQYFRFDENISNNAIEIILRHELVLSDHPYVVVSDGDLEVRTRDWLDESRQVLEYHPEVFAVGVSLDLSNLPVQAFPEAVSWVPLDLADHGDYIEALTGNWLVMFRGAELEACLEYLSEAGGRYRDSELQAYCYRARHMRWARTRRAMARHLTWDSYGDSNHPYTRLKLSRSFDEHWIHPRRAAYHELALSTLKDEDPTAMNMSMLKRKVHLGSGPVQLAGWLNTDLDAPSPELRVDLRQPLAFDDDSVDFIFSEHVIEHLTRQEGIAALKECHRILHPHGVMRVSTPDLRWAVQAYLDDKLSEWANVGWVPSTACQLLNEAMRLWGHQFLYDADELRRVFREAGFSYCRRVSWRTSTFVELSGLESRPYHHDLLFELRKKPANGVHAIGWESL